MQDSSHIVFPTILPTLLQVPLTSLHASALATLITVAEDALSRRVGAILPVLISQYQIQGTEEIHQCFEALFTHINDEGIHFIMRIFNEQMSGGADTKNVILECVSILCKLNHEDLNEYQGYWLSKCIALLSDQNVQVMAWRAFDALTARINKGEQDKYVKFVRRGITEATYGLNLSEEIHGFNLPKALAPFVQTLTYGLLYGDVSVREEASLAFGDLVDRTSDVSLKPFVTQITGPLIRVLGDRFPAKVKAAILSTMSKLLTKVPQMLKPFLPQLQRTFCKCLTEPLGTQRLRELAANCLSLLIPLQPRLDPLVVELVQGLKGGEDSGVKISIWDALIGLVGQVRGSSKLNAGSLALVQEAIMIELLKTGENDVLLRQGAGKCLGKFIGLLDSTQKQDVAQNVLSPEESNGWPTAHGQILGLIAILPTLVDDIRIGSATEMASEYLKSDKAPVATSAVDLALLIISLVPEEISNLLPAIAALIAPGPITEARLAAIQLVNSLGTEGKLKKEHLPGFVPVLMSAARDRTLPIKLAAEKCLINVFQLQEGNEYLNRYLKTLDSGASQSIGEYATRVLTKIAARESQENY